MTQRFSKYAQTLLIFLMTLLLTSVPVFGADSQALLDEVRSLVKENYIYPVDDDVLRQDTAEGIIEALGDPYSEFLSSEELQELMDSTSGSYAGVGMELVLKQFEDILYPTVISTFEASPARDGGIVPGDRIIAVDGESTVGKSIEYTVSKIKGEPESQVSLTIERDGLAFPLTVNLTRKLIQIDVVTSKMLENRIGYIAVSVFSPTSGQEVRDAVNELVSMGCYGVILDLRSNPGGYLDAGVDTAEIFVPPGPVLQFRTRLENTTIESDDYPVRIPLVVLVNGDSASASEVVAGAVKDYGVGTIVGTSTFGKGTVQAVQPLETVNAAVKLTIAEYLSPKGKKIDGQGVSPDYYIEGAEAQLDTAKRILFKPEMVTKISATKTLILDPFKGAAFLNGSNVAHSGRPYMQDNTLMVPLRLLSSFLDGDLLWNSSGRVAVLEYGNTQVVVNVGRDFVEINSETVELPVPSNLEEGRVYVPLRLISSFTDISVEWNPFVRCAEVKRF